MLLAMKLSSQLMRCIFPWFYYGLSRTGQGSNHRTRIGGLTVSISIRMTIIPIPKTFRERVQESKYDIVGMEIQISRPLYYRPASHEGHAELNFHILKFQNMISNSKRFEAAIENFDAVNSEDPRMETFENVEVPKELLYSKRMTAWLNKLFPNASEALQLSARCQHIRRWAIPRSQYPEGRAGYLQWRQDLKKFHAETAGTILKESGYDEPIIGRVQILLRKENLKHNPEVQALEDVICLVFLEYYLDGFSKKHNEERLAKILQRTWKKMSAKGRQAALELKSSSIVKSFLAKETELD